MVSYTPYGLDVLGGAEVPCVNQAADLLNGGLYGMPGNLADAGLTCDSRQSRTIARAGRG